MSSRGIRLFAKSEYVSFILFYFTSVNDRHVSYFLYDQDIIWCFGSGGVREHRLLPSARAVLGQRADVYCLLGLLGTLELEHRGGVIVILLQIAWTPPSAVASSKLV